MSFFLESARLKFRCWTLEDLPLAAALWADEDVMRHMGGPQSLEQTEVRLQGEMDRQRRLAVQYWPLFLKDGGAFVGCSGLRPFHDKVGLLELGVHISRPFWSERFGEEAARAVIAHAFDSFPVDALVAGHGPDHLHSKALLERLGFTYTHLEPWGALDVLHPFYRFEKSALVR